MDLATSAAGIGALADPVRRALYEHVISQREPVGREAAAEAVGIPVHTAKFHLERLAEEGLLESEFRRLSGRTGPGSGRPSKLYRRSAREISVSLPERRYDLLGGLLATAVTRAGTGEPLERAIQEVAYSAGNAAGALVAERRRGEPAAIASDLIADTLRELGYEPYAAGGAIRLANCPFDSLAKEHTALVCGINRDYVQGAVDGAGCPGASAAFDPRPGSCCVRVDLAPE